MKKRSMLFLNVGDNVYFYRREKGIIYGEIINVKKIDNGEGEEKKAYDILSRFGSYHQNVPEVHTNDEAKGYLFNLLKLEMARIEIEHIKAYADDRTRNREPEIVFCYQKEIRKQIEEEEGKGI